MQLIFDFSVNIYQTNKYFYAAIWVVESYTQFAALYVDYTCAWLFLNTGISQGSVAMRLSCGGIFNNNYLQIYYWVHQ